MFGLLVFEDEQTDANSGRVCDAMAIRRSDEAKETEDDEMRRYYRRVCFI